MKIPAIEKEIVVNGITVSCYDFGKGLINLVFIHGFPFDKSMWKSQLDFFKNDFRVIAYDIRGYGKSSSGNVQPSIDLYGEDLIKLMDELKIEKAVVCGLSMGGYILLNAISRFPDRFKAIILADTQCTGDTPEAKENRKKSIKAIEENGVTDFAHAFTQKIFGKYTLEKNRELVNGIEKTILSTAPETIQGTLKALAERRDMCSFLKKITVPTLIVCGKEDSITPPEKSAYMHNEITGSTYQIIENAAHMSNIEQPEKFNQIVNNFVKGIEKKI